MPAVITVEAHGHCCPGRIALAAPVQLRAQDVMTFPKDVRPGFEDLAGNPLDGKATAVQRRIDILDQKSLFTGAGSRSGTSRRRIQALVTNHLESEEKTWVPNRHKPP